MPSGLRGTALAASVAVAGQVDGCSRDTRPPTGRGTTFGLGASLMLLLVWVAVAFIMVRFHVRAGRAGRVGPVPGPVRIAVVWSFVEAAVFAVPSAAVIALVAGGALNGFADRDAETSFLLVSTLGVVLAMATIDASLVFTALGLSLWEGERWARWVTAVSSAFVGVLSLLCLIAILQVERGPWSSSWVSALAVAFTLLGFAPIPCLIGGRAKGHFARRIAPPPPVAPPTPALPADPLETASLTARWHTRR